MNAFARLTKKHSRLLIEIVGGVILIIVTTLVVFAFSPYVTQERQALYSDGSKSDAQYFRAIVTSVQDNDITVRAIDGPRPGQSDTIKGSAYLFDGKMTNGTVLLVQQTDSGTLTIVDRWRIPFLVLLALAFVLMVAFIGRRRGLMSFVGLIVSVSILFAVVIPGILQGYDTFTVITLGALAISVISIYVAHGFSRRTTISVIAIVTILLVITLMAWLATAMMGLSGKVDEISVNLGIAHPGISLSGLLAGSIIIATLGVLDDVVTTQVAAVDHLVKIKPKIKLRELFRRGSDIGREHIAALVNTLALAYAGIAFPTIVMYVAGAGFMSPLLLFNSEFIAQEVTRTLVTSIGLILAVPLSTFLATLLCMKWHGDNGKAERKE